MRKYKIIILFICLLLSFVLNSCEKRGNDNNNNNNSQLNNDIVDNEQNNDFSLENVVSNTNLNVNIQKLYSDNLDLAYAFYKNWIFDENEKIEIYDENSITSFTYRNLDINTKYKIKNLIIIKRQESYLPIMIEFESNEVAKEAFNNSMYSKETLYLVYKNVIMLNTSASFIMIEGTVEFRNKLAFNDNKKILYGRTSNSNSILTIPNKIELVCAHSFVNDKFLNEIICNDELKVIGNAAFAGCSNLSNVKFNGSLQIIEDQAFQNCDFDFIVIPKSVQKIGEEVFTSGNIFCKAESKPEGWHDGFYTGTAKVYYKGQWDYDNEGNPYVVNIDEQ